MLREFTEKLIKQVSLQSDEMENAMEMIMTGESTPAQIAAFLTALKMKGETIEEITAAVSVLRQKTERMVLENRYVVDTCGTGGDCSNSFNISTACSFVAAAAGVSVAKHGNRSVSSSSGSADVLEELGINIYLEPHEVKRCLTEINICFLFAPSFHCAMKHVGLPRKEMGFRTIFNMLGPLINPVDIQGHLLGVFDPALTEIMAEVLKNIGLERAMVVHGRDGMDEITTTTCTKVTELRDGKLKTYQLNPVELGISFVKPHQLAGGLPQENARIINRVLEGERGAARDIVLLNSAAVLYVGKKVDSLSAGVKLAAAMIDSGRAKTKLEELIVYSQGVRKDVS